MFFIYKQLEKQLFINLKYNNDELNIYIMF